MDELYDSYIWAEMEKDMATLSELDDHGLYLLVRAASFLENGAVPKQQITGSLLSAASSYLGYKQDMIETDSREQQAALKGTIAGWLGRKLEAVTRPLGFDYRTNIALVGGFAAKEVVLSTLGTAYSLG